MFKLYLLLLTAFALFTFQNCAELRPTSFLNPGASNNQASMDNGSVPNDPSVPVASSDPACSGKPDPNFPKFPNEPTNFKRVVDWGFDQIEGPNFRDAYPDPNKTGHFVTTCSDAPFSPNSVLKAQRLLEGDGSGGIQIDYYNEKFNEMYVGLIWKANAEFEGNYGNRLFIYINDAIQGFVSWNKLEGKTLDEGRIGFSPVAGPNVNNCHLVGTPCVPGSLNLDANIKPNHIAPRGKWNLVEAILKRSSAPGAKDGRIRWYLNGELLGDYSRLDTGGPQIHALSYQQGWVNRILVNHTQNTDWYYLADHIRISGLN